MNRARFYLSLALLATACNQSPELALDIRLPDDIRLLASVTQVNLSATRDDVVLAQHAFSVRSGYVSLNGVTHGADTVIELDGLDSSSRVIARGRTCPVDFESAGQRAPLYFAPTNFFAPTANAPIVERTQPIAAALTDGSVVITGGTNGSGSLIASTELFTVGAGTFATSASTIASPRQQAQGVVLTSIGLLVTGGLDANGKALASAELYFEPEQTFLPIAGLDARVGHRIAVLTDGRALITGGHGDDDVPLATTSIVYVLDDGTYQVSAGPPLAIARSEHAMVSVTSNRSLVFGGYGTDGAPLASIELVDAAATVAAAPIANLKTARAKATASVLDSGVLVVGGVDANDRPLATAELLDSFGNATTVFTMATARYGHTATVLSDKRVLIAGGFDANHNALDSVELFSTSVGFVTERALGTPRGDHAAVALCDDTVLLVGGAATAELYTEPAL